VLPIRITHFLSVGEGVALHLEPDDTGAWNHWGDFESDIEVAVRPRLAHTWRQKLSLSEVEAWLRKEASSYLRRLEAAATAS
jgi:hypothetical protein